MPQQATFFDEKIGDLRVVVLKSYDPTYAREAFDQMQPEALRHLRQCLEVDVKYDTSGVPSPEDEEYPDALWEEVQNCAREDWNTFSYFIVSEEVGGRSSPIYVSSDWPSAEAFAKKRLEAKG